MLMMAKLVVKKLKVIVQDMLLAANIKHASVFDACEIEYRESGQSADYKTMMGDMSILEGEALGYKSVLKVLEQISIPDKKEADFIKWGRR